jgi:hypothetical protein
VSDLLDILKKLVSKDLLDALVDTIKLILDSSDPSDLYTKDFCQAVLKRVL